MTARPVLSTLAISGGSASLGNWSTIRETRSRIFADEAELDADVGPLVAAAGRQLLDAFDAGHDVLDDLRDLGLDDLGGSTPVTGLDRNHR
jgi:hypothetical protein